MESSRSRRSELEDAGVFAACDCTSYCYFSLAVILFTVGTVITVLALDEAGGNMFSNLGHMWLVGPIFISSGLMVAVKTVLYLRKKNLVTLINRQRALLRVLIELHGLQLHNQQQQMVRNPSVLTLPPAYELVAGQGDQTGRPSTNQTTSTSLEEPAPPSYEEALLLGQRLQRNMIINPTSFNEFGIGKDSMV